MRFSIFITILVLACSPSSNQLAINLDLKIELDSIFQLDQSLRRELSQLSQNSEQNAVAIDSLWKEIRRIDARNLLRIKQIIHSHGYPGKSLVGEESSDVAFFVLQHSPADVMESYKDVIFQAGREGELDLKRVAMFHDRLLMHDGKQQLYGTQLKEVRLYDSILGAHRTVKGLYPIYDFDGMDRRRDSMGLEPFEDFAARNGIKIMP